MLKIDFSRQAKKFFKNLHPKYKRQISEKIQSLLLIPFPNDSKALKGFSEYFRTDVGEHRIVYLVSSDVLKIYLVGKRNDDEIYRKFKRMM